jgi:hypothetical protein
LSLEALELRSVPSTVSWINPAGGDWDTGGNWTGGSPPTVADDVSISGLNLGASVTHLANTSYSVNRLYLYGSFENAGFLTVNSLMDWRGTAITLSGPGSTTLGPSASLTIGSTGVDDQNIFFVDGQTFDNRSRLFYTADGSCRVRP